MTLFTIWNIQFITQTNYILGPILHARVIFTILLVNWLINSVIPRFKLNLFSNNVYTYVYYLINYSGMFTYLQIPSTGQAGSSISALITSLLLSSAVLYSLLLFYCAGLPSDCSSASGGIFCISSSLLCCYYYSLFHPL